MVIKQEVAYGIVESIADLRKGNDLEDFTVIVDGTEVKCHRFILGACSHFFRALLRSDMKEREENCTILNDVSHPTFTQILSALYTGIDVLTSKNVIDIWYAANHLQIGFMMEECENFIKGSLSLDNYEEIYRHAKLLDSKYVLSALHNFMLKHFDVFRKSQLMPELPFSELFALIKSDKLIVASEDGVIEAILRWVSHAPANTSANAHQSSSENDKSDNHETQDPEDGPTSQSISKDIVSSDNENSEVHKNESSGDQADSHLDDDERSSDEKDVMSNVAHVLANVRDSDISQEKHQNNPESLVTIQADKKHAKLSTKQELNIIPVQEQRVYHLIELLTVTRLCLASSDCLEMLFKNAMIKNCEDARNLIFEAVCYQLQIGRRHGQWPEAARHRCSSELENVMIWTAANTKVYSFSDHNHHEITSPPQAYIFDSITAYDNKPVVLSDSDIYVCKQGVWVHLGRGPGYEPIALSYDKFIYLFSTTSGEAHRFNPKIKPLTLERVTGFPAIKSTAALVFEKKMLVFSVENKDGEKQTVVHCFDPTRKDWERLDNLNGPATSLISFHNDTNTYLLQINGNVWKVTSSETGSVKISFCQKVWEFEVNLCGAAFFGSTLYIGCVPKQNILPRIMPGVTRDVRYVTFKRKVSLVPIIMLKRQFQIKE